MRNRWAALCAVAAVVFLAGCGAGTPQDPKPAAQTPQCTSAEQPSPPPAGTLVTTAQVLAAVKAAQCLTAVPDSVAASLSTYEKATPIDGAGCEGFKNATNVMFGECDYGDPNGAKLMVIYGDSRSEMWAATLQGVARKNGWKLRVFSRGNCPGADLQFAKPSQQEAEDCDAFHAAAVSAIQALHPDLVVTTSLAWLGVHLRDGSNPTAAQWTDGWKSMFTKLGSPGTRLAMIGTIPDWGEPNMGPRCLAGHLKDVQKCTAPAGRSTPNGADAEKAAAEAVGAVYIPAMPWVCADRCEPVISGFRVFNEGKHFTQSYAVYLTGALNEALQPVLT